MKIICYNNDMNYSPTPNIQSPTKKTNNYNSDSDISSDFEDILDKISSNDYA
jgi:hypothetical protein